MEAGTHIPPHEHMYVCGHAPSSHHRPRVSVSRRLHAVALACICVEACWTFIACFQSFFLKRGSSESSQVLVGERWWKVQENASNLLLANQQNVVMKEDFSCTNLLIIKTKKVTLKYSIIRLLALALSS